MRQPEATHDDPPSEGQGTSQGVLSASATAQGPGLASPESSSVVWVKVKLAATAHSDASIASHILRYYPVGTELEVFGRKNGWVHVRAGSKDQRAGMDLRKALPLLDR
jgi:hypothetical protein